MGESLRVLHAAKGKQRRRRCSKERTKQICLSLQSSRPLREPDVCSDRRGNAKQHRMPNWTPPRLPKQMYACALLSTHEVYKHGRNDSKRKQAFSSCFPSFSITPHKTATFCLPYLPSTHNAPRRESSRKFTDGGPHARERCACTARRHVHPLAGV